jgi:ABC-type Mn2+/Zn2+ transport system ATPase subunit
VLRGVSFAVERGEFTALLGPNGSGKTTLFRGILGLIPLLGGRVAYGFDRRARPPGYVPQREALDPIFPLTAFEVVLMGAAARCPPAWPAGRRVRRLAARCLAQVGLGALEAQPFWALSGGQKQRVLIARALAVEPELLLLDEPTAGIDPGAEAAVMDVIQQLRRDRGLTVVVVSHNLRVIRSLAHAVVWVDGGTAVKGTTAEMFASPRLLEAFGLAG